MKKLLLLLLAGLFFISCNLFDESWGKESSLNGTWTGYMRTADGTTASMQVTLKDGNVSSGKLEYKYLTASSIVGSYFYDGDKFKMDFDNEASDFEGNGTTSSLSGDRIVGGSVDGVFALSK